MGAAGPRGREQPGLRVHVSVRRILNMRAGLGFVFFGGGDKGPGLCRKSKKGASPLGETDVSEGKERERRD